MAQKRKTSQRPALRQYLPRGPRSNPIHGFFGQSCHSAQTSSRRDPAPLAAATSSPNVDLIGKSPNNFSCSRLWNSAKSFKVFPLNMYSVAQHLMQTLNAFNQVNQFATRVSYATKQVSDHAWKRPPCGERSHRQLAFVGSLRCRRMRFVS